MTKHRIRTGQLVRHRDRTCLVVDAIGDTLFVRAACGPEERVPAAECEPLATVRQARPGTPQHWPGPGPKTEKTPYER